jgi:predicted nucleic acid-binding protein
VAQIPFTPLHDLEVRNAFQALRGRHLITRGELRALTAVLDADLQANRLLWTSLDLAAVFADARHLAEAHTVKLLCRSLDLLHLAAARAIGCSRLISGDDRQLKLARVLRFATVDIKKPPRRRRIA